MEEVNTSRAAWGRRRWPLSGSVAGVVGRQLGYCAEGASGVYLGARLQSLSTIAFKISVAGSGKGTIRGGCCAIGSNKMVTLKCGACGKLLEIADEYQGKTGKCYGCGGPISVPYVQAAPVAATSPNQSHSGIHVQTYVQAAPIPAMPQIVLVRQSKTRFIYVLLGLFFGGFGIHNFYAGYTGRGVAQLLITVFSPLLLFVPLLCVGLWVLVELIVITRDSTGQEFA